MQGNLFVYLFMIFIIIYIYSYVYLSIYTSLYYALTNGRRRVPKCPSRGTNQPILLSTWQKRKWKKGRLLDFQAFPEKPKFLDFVEQKVDNKFWKGFTLALCQREDLGASVEAFPFAKIPLKKKSLAFFCFHFWKHSISSAILKRLQPFKRLFVDNKQLNWDAKELL